MKRYLHFFGWYLVVAVAGTLLILAIAPILRANIPPRTLTTIRNGILSTTPGTTAPQPPGVTPPSLQPPPAMPDRPIQGQATTTQPPALSPSDSRSTAPGTQGAGEAIASSTTASPEKAAPIPSDSQSSGLDYSRMWGVVRGMNTYIFDKTGNPTVQVDPGTLVEIAAIKTSATDRVAICRIKGRSEQGGLSLIRANNLTIQSGTLNSANNELINLLMRQSILSAEIEMMAQMTPEREDSRNPHTAAYRDARNKLKAFLQTAQELKGKFDTAQGAERAQLVDRLRNMKQDEVLLNQQFTDAKQRFEAWNQTHGTPLAESQEVRNMRAELARIDAEIKRLEK